MDWTSVSDQPADALLMEDQGRQAQAKGFAVERHPFRPASATASRQACLDYLKRFVVNIANFYSRTRTAPRARVPEC